MSIKLETSNKRSLIITTKDSLIMDINNVVPCVVLITAWKLNDVSIKIWEPLIKGIIERGCACIVCAGTYSEDLHDAIDDLIYEYDEWLENKPYKNIITTYHDDESLEDVVNYYVHGTELWDKEKGGLVCVINYENSEDKEIIKLLEET